MKNRILTCCFLIFAFTSAIMAQNIPGINTTNVKSDFSTAISPNGNLIITAIAYTFNGKTDLASLADSAHHSTYDTIASSFNLTVRTYYSYDSGGLLIQRITKSPDKTGTWKNYSLDTLSYTGPLLMKVISRQWDSQLADWKNALKYDYFYDTSNTLTSIVISHWSTSSNEWRFSERTAYNYNTSNQVSQELQQVWNSSLSSWDDNSKSTYAYTSSKLSGILTEQWNTATLSWANNTRTTLSYTSGLNTETVLEKYIQALSVWVNQTRDLYVYNISGKVDSQITQVWETDKWVNSVQYQNTYAGSDLTSVLTKQWISSKKDWSNEQSDDYYFSQHEVFGTPSLSSSAILLANPLVKGSRVRITGLTAYQNYEAMLHNLNGQIVMQQSLHGDGLIYIPGKLETGIYILQLISPEGIILIRKMLITD